jgi:hypothetical protein
VRSWEQRAFEDTVRRERLLVEEPDGIHVVREQYPADKDTQRAEPHETDRHSTESGEQGGFLGNLMRKALQ